MEIRKVTDPEFKVYGKIVTGYDCGELLKAMGQTPVPEDVVYVASDRELEGLEVSKRIQKNMYGQLPIQVGYCNGRNRKMNAMEYHRTSEINVAATDLVLMLGRQQDVGEDGTYDTSLAEAFLVPAGTVIEVYATTLHYAPCHVEEDGFRCVVILPKGTNTDMEPVEELFFEDKLLFAKNKWLIGHREGGLPKNAYLGLRGSNPEL
ncbi:MAG: DUF4867 family protein [Hungatella sp.]|jgi:hypothetical protein|nr:DUF4867 family protein [Hungatella sp.]